MSDNERETEAADAVTSGVGMDEIARAVRTILPALRSDAWANSWHPQSPAIQALVIFNTAFDPGENIDHLLAVARPAMEGGN